MCEILQLRGSFWFCLFCEKHIQYCPRESHAWVWDPICFHTKLFWVKWPRLKIREKITNFFQDFATTGALHIALYNTVRITLIYTYGKDEKSGVGVTKPVSSILLFSAFFSIVKTHVSYWISCLYLADVAAAQSFSNPHAWAVYYPK